jgi:type II secretion system protein D
MTPPGTTTPQPAAQTQAIQTPAAQQPANPPIVPPPDNTAPPTAAQTPVVPASPQPANTAQTPVQSGIPVAAPGQEMIRMQYPNADVKEVLSLYERLTMKKLVYDNTVQGPVNIFISSPVNRDEAVKIIEINLLLNGFSLVPAQDPSIIKVIGLGKNARAAGVPIISDIDQLPEGERIVTFVFKLKYAEPQELQQTLSQYIPPSTSTSFVPLQKSQIILVTENTSVIRGLAKIIKEIDIAPAEVVSEFIPLERADAKDVIEKLEKIFEKPQAQGTAGGAPRPVPNQPPQPAAPVPEGSGPTVEIQAGALSEDSVVVGKIRLTADIRTNRIHVITRPVNIPFVRKLISEFDSDVPFGEPAKRPLKFVSASEVLEILVKAITEPGMKADDSGGGGTGANGQKNTNQSNQNQNQYGSNNGYGGSNGGSLNVSEELTTQSVDTTPRAVTVGNTKIIADPRENTIIVLGNKQVQEKIFTLLDEIDVRAPQVMLNTIIGEFSINDDKKFGVDYLLKPGALKTGTNGFALATLARNFGLTQFGALSALGSAGGISGVISPTDNLDIIVNALESTGRFRVTQRPMIYTSNNKKAIIASGEQIAVPTSTLSNVNNGAVLNNTASVSASVQYQPVELKLEVVPLINSDREVSLDIVQKLDSLSGASQNVAGTSVPTITTRYIKTNVSVPNRGTVVLGGLIKKSMQDGADGIPILSRIPVLGYFFKNTTKNNDREELIILIRPVVTNSPAEQVKNSQDEQRRLLIEPDVESTITTEKPTPAPKPVKFRN